MRALKDRRDLGFGIVVVGCGGVLGGGSIKRGVLGGVGEDGGRVLRPLALWHGASWTPVPKWRIDMDLHQRLLYMILYQSPKSQIYTYIAIYPAVLHSRNSTHRSPGTFRQLASGFGRASQIARRGLGFRVTSHGS